MEFESRIKRILENEGLYNNKNFEYVLSKIRNTNQNDTELESQILEIIFKKTKRTFCEQMDGYKNSDERFEDVLRIFNPQYEYDPQHEYEPQHEYQSQAKLDSSKYLYETDNEEINNFFKTFTTESGEINSIHDNFFNNSVYGSNERSHLREEIKEKGSVFIKHALVFGIVSAIYAYLDPVGLRTGNFEPFFKVFTKSFFEINAIYGGIELYKFIRDYCFNFDGCYNKRRV